MSMQVTETMLDSMAERIIASMSKPELEQYVYDDLFAIMSEDDEVFWANVEAHGLDIEALQR